MSSKTFCDVCGGEIPEGNLHNHVRVTREKVTGDEEGYFGWWDICMDCWKQYPALPDRPQFYDK